MAVKDIIKNTKAILDKKYGNKDRVYTTFNELISVPKKHTGSLYLDYAFGGGFVEGRIYNFYGPPSSGKSAIAGMISSQYQKSGLPVVYIDAECGFDAVYTRNTFGFDIEDEDTVLFSQEDDGGKVYSTAEICAKNGFKLIVIDSTDALLTSAEAQADYDQAMMTQKARLNSLALAKLKGILSEYKCSLILISQERDKIGGYVGGNTVSGGQAIKFYSSVRARVSKSEIIRIDPKIKTSEAIGQTLEVNIQKNKVGMPFRKVMLSLYYNKGFVKQEEIIDLALQYGLLVKGGSWYSYNNEFKLQGRESVVEWFNEHTNSFSQLEEQVKNTLLNDVSSRSVPIIEAEDYSETEIEKAVKSKPYLNEENGEAFESSDDSSEAVFNEVIQQRRKRAKA
jgi:recombination protein RecA